MKWTKENLEKLTELYPDNTNKKLATLFGVSVQSITTKAKILKLRKSKDLNSYDNKIKWNNENTNKLIELYPLHTNREIASFFKTTISTISNKARKLKISKPKNFQIKVLKKIIWSKENIKKLIELYPDNKNEDLAKMFNTTVMSINCKSRRLNLYKTKEFKSSLISKRNKIIGRDLDYKLLSEIAKKFKTRGEFQRKDASAYSTARLSGILDEICVHMFKQNYSIPQLTLSYIVGEIISKNILYNTRKVIKPFELDIYIDEFKLAFEYDGKGWHKNKEYDENKNNLCKNKNINLIRIKENNRNYISDIKTQLIENLFDINKYTFKSITPEDILNIRESDIDTYINNNILDDEYIKKCISKYNNYHDFFVSEKTLYQKLRKSKCLHKYTSHLKKQKTTWTEELIKNEVSKYKTLSEFIKNSKGCYLYVKRHKLNFLLVSLERKITKNNNKTML